MQLTLVEPRTSSKQASKLAGNLLIDNILGNTVHFLDFKIVVD